MLDQLLPFIPEQYRPLAVLFILVIAALQAFVSQVVAQLPASALTHPRWGWLVRIAHRFSHARLRGEAGTMKLPGSGARPPAEERALLVARLAELDATPSPARDTTGQRGAAQLSAMAWALLVSLGLGVVLYAAVAVTGCTPAREAVMRVTPGVPDPVECTADTWRCHGSQPEHCSASGRWWPSLSRRADGTQRQCARGCSMDASGVASCVGPVEAGVSR